MIKILFTMIQNFYEFLPLPVTIENAMSKPRYVYHYTTLKTVLENIFPDNQLRLGPLIKTNDPYEAQLWEIGGWNHEREAAFDKPLDELKKGAKVLCTCMDKKGNRKSPIAEIRKGTPRLYDCYGQGFSIPYMWAHYGGNHTGVCLELNRERLKEAINEKANESKEAFSLEKSIHYPELVGNTNPTKHLIPKNCNFNDLEWVKKIANRLLFIKDKAWEHEREYRFLVFDKSDKDILVPSEDVVAGIVLGSKFPSDYYRRLDHYCALRSIPWFQLEWTNGEPWALSSSVAITRC